MARWQSGEPAGAAAPPGNLAELRDRIVRHQIVLPRRQAAVLRYMIENPAEASFSTYRSMAQACGVSVTLVRQMVLNVGFAHYRDFRDLFRRALRLAPG